MTPKHKIINLNEIADARGSLSFAQLHDQLPFQPARIFMLYAMPDGAKRGDHAHRQQHQFVMMMHGSAEIEVDDGSTRTPVILGSPSQALYVPPMLWLRLKFPKSAVCAVLASGIYEETDYIRSYDEFRALTKSGSAA